MMIDGANAAESTPKVKRSGGAFVNELKKQVAAARGGVKGAISISLRAR